MKQPNQILNEETIETFLKDFPQWNYTKEKTLSYLSFEHSFVSFKSAFLFLTKLALVSESLDHHAEIWNVYNNVRLKLYTHELNAITTKDLELIQMLMEEPNEFF
ncbi:4a-hydroxytetrahydrobiopterin dehydratase [Leptospira levettii]|uniref:4a-hydroxytetrahydrobiopterin dehydratase n=1 Tax=Leptospira levettii TaxID=2023178 RepID=UPI001082B83C|nr:4a-hydroxytetrahydrobiopterin dehydratase [Leptospira levettii]TGM69951.1 4a-hydroxytetrahydrobiopterin dehydratase [Leptospira levettii]